MVVYLRYAATTWQKETDLPVIGFDMGGTSTDVSRFAGKYEHVYESTTAGVTIQAPQLDVNTVAAGGGSMLFFRLVWWLWKKKYFVRILLGRVYS